MRIRTIYNIIVQSFTLMTTKFSNCDGGSPLSLFTSTNAKPATSTRDACCPVRQKNAAVWARQRESEWRVRHHQYAGLDCSSWPRSVGQLLRRLMMRVRRNAMRRSAHGRSGGGAVLSPVSNRTEGDAFRRYSTAGYLITPVFARLCTSDEANQQQQQATLPILEMTNRQLLQTTATRGPCTFSNPRRVRC